MRLPDSSPDRLAAWILQGDLRSIDDLEKVFAAKRCETDRSIHPRACTRALLFSIPPHFISRLLGARFRALATRKNVRAAATHALLCRVRQVRRRHPLRRAEGRGGERRAPGAVLRQQPRRHHQPLQDHEEARLHEGTCRSLPPVRLSPASVTLRRRRRRRHGL